MEALNPPSQSEDTDLYATLLEIPSRFERLVYVSKAAGATGSGAQQVDREHVAAFDDWLAQGLCAKLDDWKLFAAGQGSSALILLLYWAQPKNHSKLVPAGAQRPQRELFAQELEVLFLVA